MKLPDIVVKKRQTLGEKTASRSKRSRCHNVVPLQQPVTEDVPMNAKLSATFSEMNSNCAASNDDSSSLIILGNSNHHNGLSSSLDIDVSLSREIELDMSCDLNNM